MNHLSAGRGRGRFNGRGGSGRGMSPYMSKGTIPTIGAFLMCSNGVNANSTILWMGKIKEYVIANFTTRVDEIFGANGTVGSLPTQEKLKDPTETGSALQDKLRYKKWELALNAYTAFEAKLETEKVQVFGVMLGQMSGSSKDLVKECELGRTAFQERCPLNLLKSIVATHMSDSRLGAPESLYHVTDAYARLTMETSDTISSFYRKTQSLLAARHEALLRCGYDDENIPEDDDQQAIKFIKCLLPKYDEFKGFFRNGLVEYPCTLEDAFTQASTYRTNNNDRYINRNDIFTFSGRGGRGRTGRGRNYENNNNIQYICYNCGKNGHRSFECRNPPATKEQQDINKAIAEQRKEAASNLGALPEKK